VRERERVNEWISDKVEEIEKGKGKREERDVKDTASVALHCTRMSTIGYLRKCCHMLHCGLFLRNIRYQCSKVLYYTRSHCLYKSISNKRENFNKLSLLPERPLWMRKSLLWV
jgi:hypothetical protein